MDSSSQSSSQLFSQLFSQSFSQSALQSSYPISKDDTYNLLSQRHGAERQKKLSEACVGIAGLGGLGSHVAIHLARLGIACLILADFDVVDETNLHRQHYTFRDIGQEKQKALIKQLRDINPYIEYKGHNVKLTAQNIPHIFLECDVICEAFDDPFEKAMLTECVLTEMDKPILVGASGMAGTGSPNKMLVKHPMRRYYICGDGESDVKKMHTLFAPRVALCAAQQATIIMQIVLDELDLDTVK